MNHLSKMKAALLLASLSHHIYAMDTGETDRIEDPGTLYATATLLLENMSLNETNDSDETTEELPVAEVVGANNASLEAAANKNISLKCPSAPPVEPSSSSADESSSKGQSSSNTPLITIDEQTMLSRLQSMETGGKTVTPHMFTKEFLDATKHGYSQVVAFLLKDEVIEYIKEKNQNYFDYIQTPKKDRTLSCEVDIRVCKFNFISNLICISLSIAAEHEHLEMGKTILSCFAAKDLDSFDFRINPDYKTYFDRDENPFVKALKKDNNDYILMLLDHPTVVRKINILGQNILNFMLVKFSEKQNDEIVLRLVGFIDENYKPSLRGFENAFQISINHRNYDLVAAFLDPDLFVYNYPKNYANTGFGYNPELDMMLIQNAVNLLKESQAAKYIAIIKKHETACTQEIAAREQRKQEQLEAEQRQEKYKEQLRIKEAKKSAEEKARHHEADKIYREKMARINAEIEAKQKDLEARKAKAWFPGLVW